MNSRWRRAVALVLLAAGAAALLAGLLSGAGGDAGTEALPRTTAPAASPSTAASTPGTSAPEQAEVEVLVPGPAAAAAVDDVGGRADPLVLALPMDYVVADAPAADDGSVRLRTADGRACSIVASRTPVGAVGQLQLDASVHDGDLHSIDLDPSTDQRTVTSATFPTGTRSPRAQVLIAHRPDGLTEVTCDDLVTAARLAARIRIGSA
ncbi:MAG: hypothetical protein AAGK32_16070 [Actinomycetota bacterium]